jgi:branched-chain amino acid transport system ATP-binding protein
MTLLAIERLNAWYGKSHILHDVTFEVRAGETVALLGRNGAGKTTTMRSIMGLMPRIDGRIALGGEDIAGLRCHAITRKGLSLVPENRGIFATLTVAENIQLGVNPSSPWKVDEALAMFPALKQRWSTPGGKLSGGEQQMLAIARALLVGPRLLLLDEPTEGLAPVIVERVVGLIRQLKASGLSILLVEQSLDVCRAVADRHLIIDGGRVVWRGDTPALNAAPEIVERHLTLEHA